MQSLKIWARNGDKALLHNFSEWRCFFISSMLVRQELLALSNLPHLLYQLDKGAAVLDKSFRHLVQVVIDVFDINFGCRSSHASQPHAGSG